MLQRVLGPIHLCTEALTEVAVKRRIHPTKKCCSNGGPAKLAILNCINPCGHPAAADKRLVRLPLERRRLLDRFVVQPDIRNVELRERTAKPVPCCRLPSDPKQDRLAGKLFVSSLGPDFFSNQVRHMDALSAPPNTSRSIKGQLFCRLLRLTTVSRLATGNDLANVAVNLLPEASRPYSREGSDSARLPIAARGSQQAPFRYHDNAPHLYPCC